MKPLLIVGQGLAGTILACKLLDNNIPFNIIDNPVKFTASKVASGLYNPIVLKRMKPVWNASKFMENIADFYSTWEMLLGVSFHEKLDIIRLFSSIEEQNNWNQYLDNPALNPYLCTQPLPSGLKNIKDEFGHGVVKNCGWVNTAVFLTTTKFFFQTQNILQESIFDFNKIQFEGKHLSYLQQEYSKIIFCEGYKTLCNNPFFKHLPFALTKGEVIEIESAALNLTNAINAGIFILPLHDNRYKVGATYSWDPIDELPSESALKTLTDQLEDLITVPYKIISHQAGVRPTVKDRKPIIGFHHNHPNIGIFNGMGSRGVLMAPALADAFVDLLTQNKPLPHACDVNRFLN